MINHTAERGWTNVNRDQPSLFTKSKYWLPDINHHKPSLGDSPYNHEIFNMAFRSVPKVATKHHPCRKIKLQFMVNGAVKIVSKWWLISWLCGCAVVNHDRSIWVCPMVYRQVTGGFPTLNNGCYWMVSRNRNLLWFKGPNGVMELWMMFGL